MSPECSAAGLESPADTCDGPWQFSWSRTCNDPAICGFSSTCATFNTCSGWQIGITKTPKVENPSTIHTFVETETCSGPNWQNCTTTYTTSPSVKCASVATARKNAIIATVPTTANGYTEWKDIFDVFGSSVFVSETHTTSGGNSPNQPINFITTTKHKCKLTIPNFPSPKTAPHSSCGCQAFAPNSCVCETGQTTTIPAPDAPKPATSGTDKVFTAAPACLTCDDPDFQPEGSDATAMVSCLSAGLGTGSAELTTARIARMKLVLQLAGHSLDEEDRALVEGLYDQSPAAPACQQPLGVESACAASAQSPSGVLIDEQLQLCADLAGDHVPVDAVRAELPHCLGVLGEVAALPAGACRDTLRDLGAAIVATLVERTASAYQPADGLENDMVETLHGLDAWYEALAPISDPTVLRAQSGALAGVVWRSAHQAALPLPSAAGSDAVAAALLADVGETGLEIDWALLRAAFDPSAPIDSPPLLFLVGDALRGTIERLEQVSPIHDVACRFEGCAPTVAGGPPLATPVSEAWRLLGALDDAGALTEALAGAGALASQHPTMVSALQAIAQQHEALAVAWDRAAAAPLSTLGDATASAPVEGASLAALVRASRARSDSYAATGSFAATRSHLSSAVLKQQELVGFIDYGADIVEGAAQEFAAARLETVNDLLTQTQAAGNTQSVLDRLAVDVHDTRELLGQLGGLRAREASEHSAIGELMSAFATVVESDAFDADAAYQVDVLPPVEIAPQDAHFTPTATFDLAVVRAHVVTLTSGEILEVDMSDATWTPTCALDISNIASPGGVGANIDVAGAVTGPEGYYVDWVSSQYQARGINSSSSYTESTLESFAECDNFTAGWPPPNTGIASVFSASISYTSCTTDSFGYTETEGSSASAGTEKRSSASFRSGLRLPNTPFPNAPVGSLVAVLTAHDFPEHVLDVRVVDRRDAIQAPSLDAGLGTEVDVHFVVNDVDGACAPPADDSLQLNMRVITPAGLVAQAVGTAMAQAIDEIEDQAPAILAQGGMTGADASALRTGAWGRLTLLLAGQGYGLQGLPVELKNLYEAWIDKAIASLGRRGEMQRVQRDLSRIRLDVQALRHELGSSEAESRLLALIPRWRLRALAGIELEPSIAALSEILSDYAAPIFELRDPVNSSGFQSTAAAQLGALLDVDFAAPLDEAGENLRLFAVSARNSLQAAQFELPTQARRTVVLAFPRDPSACEGLCDEFRQASMQAAEMAWQGVQEEGHVGRLQVQAADLYAASGGNARLSCNDLAPVVRRASVYMLNPSNTAVDLAALGRELPAVAGEGASRFAFPHVGSALELTADTEAGVPLSLPVINGPGGDVLSDFGTSAELGVGAGISPFSTFTVDFGSFYTDAPITFIDETVAVLLVLEVERRVSTSDSFVPGICQDEIP